MGGKDKLWQSHRRQGGRFGARMVFFCILFVLTLTFEGMHATSPRKEKEIGGWRKVFDWVISGNSRKSRQDKSRQSHKTKKKCSNDKDCKNMNEECFLENQLFGYCQPKNVCIRYRHNREGRTCITLRKHCFKTSDCPKESKCIQNVELNRGHCEEPSFNILDPSAVQRLRKLSVRCDPPNVCPTLFCIRMCAISIVFVFNFLFKYLSRTDGSLHSHGYASMIR